MILEVNNTFDERRMYLLKGPETDEAVSEGLDVDSEVRRLVADDGAKNKASIPSDPGSSKYASTWPKDFHVSPFNSRKGSYSLSAVDPFAPHLLGKGSISNNIVLKSSKHHFKLNARVFSTSDPIDPFSFNTWGTFRFLASWWWVGFVTFPRIVREAAKLFFRRKLHVWYRPEVLKDSIGRIATEDERYVVGWEEARVMILLKESGQSHRRDIPRFTEEPCRELYSVPPCQVHPCHPC